MKDKKKIILIIIFILAVILRLSYIIKTPYNIRQHDIGEINDSQGLNYIFTIYNTRTSTTR